MMKLKVSDLYTQCYVNVSVMILMLKVLLHKLHLQKISKYVYEYIRIFHQKIYEQSAIFDLPSEHDEQLQSSWKDSPRIQMGPITKLPELDEASMNDHNSYSRGGGGGGGGNRNSGRSSKNI